MKIVFMGTPDFSAIVLEKLNSVYPVSCVVTGLDKPPGADINSNPLRSKSRRKSWVFPSCNTKKFQEKGLTICEISIPTSS